MSKPNNKEYGNRAVAFIDILGFASMVRRMDKSGDDYNTLMHALKKIKKYQEFAGSEITVQSKLEISVFSDCIACLLYTSPSPRDQRGSRMPSSA